MTNKLKILLLLMARKTSMMGFLAFQGIVEADFRSRNLPPSPMLANQLKGLNPSSLSVRSSALTRNTPITFWGAGLHIYAKN